MGNILSKKYSRLQAKSAEETTLIWSPQVSSAAFDAKIESVTNESFGTASNLIKNNEPIVHKIDSESGDGWITKRHISSASITIKLCNTSRIIGLDIDTTGFREMCPTYALVEGYQVTDKYTSGMWTTLINDEPLTEDGHNFFQLFDEKIYSHIRLTVSPGGGIARFRIYGDIVPDWPDLSKQYNLASANDGARIVHWSDLKNGNNPNVLLDNGTLTTSGWLTPRCTKTERNDFIVIQLSSPGILKSIQVDTTGFIGNSPLRIEIDGCYSNELNPYNDSSVEWTVLIPEIPVTENYLNKFQVIGDQLMTHVRLTVIPDGGVQQIKCIGFVQQQKKDETSHDVHTDVNSTNDCTDTLIQEELQDSQPAVSQLRICHEIPLTPPAAEKPIPITDPDLYEKTIIEELNGSTTQLLIPVTANAGHTDITSEDKKELEASDIPLVEQLNMAHIPVSPVSVQSPTVRSHSMVSSYSSGDSNIMTNEQTTIEETTTIIEEKVIEIKSTDVGTKKRGRKRKSPAARSEASTKKKRAVPSRSASPVATPTRVQAGRRAKSKAMEEGYRSRTITPPAELADLRAYGSEDGDNSVSVPPLQAFVFGDRKDKADALPSVRKAQGSKKA